MPLALISRHSGQLQQAAEVCLEVEQPLQAHQALEVLVARTMRLPQRDLVPATLEGDSLEPASPHLALQQLLRAHSAVLPQALPSEPQQQVPLVHPRLPL